MPVVSVVVGDVADIVDGASVSLSLSLSVSTTPVPSSPHAPIPNPKHTKGSR
jgi:hypothetical protein